MTTRRRWLGACAVLITVCVVGASTAAAAAGTVAVPVGEQDVSGTYDALHGAGLLVNVPRRLTFRIQSPTQVADETPAAYTLVPAGSAVTLSGFGSAPYLPEPESNFSPDQRLPLHTRRVPRFVGGSAARVATWAASRQIPLTVSLGPLRDGRAVSLLANYRVTKQSLMPGPGLTQRLSISAVQPPKTVGRPVQRALAPCSLPAGYRVIADDGGVVLATHQYHHARTSGSTTDFGGCDPAANRLFPLGSDQSEPYGENETYVLNTLLSGRFAGVSSGYNDKYDNCSAGFQVVDLTDGATVHQFGDDCQSGSDDLYLVALSPVGDAAFVAPSADAGGTCAGIQCGVGLWADDDQGPRLIDEAIVAPGAAVPFSDVTISGDTLSWTNDGVAKTAPLS